MYRSYKKQQQQQKTPYLYCTLLHRKNLWTFCTWMGVDYTSSVTRAKQELINSCRWPTFFSGYIFFKFLRRISYLIFRWWWITLESRPVTPYFSVYLVSKAAISYFLDLTTKSAVWPPTTINNYPIPASTFTSDSGFMFTLFSLCSKSSSPDGNFLKSQDQFVYLFFLSFETCSSLESEHLLYLQLRKDLLEQRWVMDPMEEMGLAALALTIEFGTYNQKVNWCSHY